MEGIGRQELVTERKIYLTLSTTPALGKFLPPRRKPSSHSKTNPESPRTNHRGMCFGWTKRPCPAYISVWWVCVTNPTGPSVLALALCTSAVVAWMNQKILIVPYVQSEWVTLDNIKFQISHSQVPVSVVTLDN